MRNKAFFFLFLVTTACYAQKSFMSLTMGSSIPVGSFSETEDIYSDGFAGSNFVINFDGAYFFMPVVGMGGTFSFGSSYGGGESLENALYDDIIEKFPILTVPADPDYNFDAGKWNYVNLMAGPQISIPLNNINIDFKALGGLSFIFVPSRDISIELDNVEFQSSTNGDVLNLGYIIGTGVRFGVGRGTGIRLGLDYYHSKPALVTNNSYTSNNIPHDLQDDQFEISMNSLHMALGIAFNF
ncbi:MAG: hypothetical protein J7K53_11270 [Bacteroidales bacterium]|nr:hypothetical protein [Bacteroidales bacterium]